MWNTSSVLLVPLRTRSSRSVPACYSARSSAGSVTKQTRATAINLAKAKLAASGKPLFPIIHSLPPCNQWDTSSQVCIISMLCTPCLAISSLGNSAYASLCTASQLLLLAGIDQSSCHNFRHICYSKCCDCLDIASTPNTSRTPQVYLTDQNVMLI